MKQNAKVQKEMSEKKKKIMEEDAALFGDLNNQD